MKVLYTTAVNECAAKAPGSRLLIIENEEENKRILDYRRAIGGKSNYNMFIMFYSNISEKLHEFKFKEMENIYLLSYIGFQGCSILFLK